MLVKCKYDPIRDVGKTFQGLAPDIDKLIETHQVMDTTGEVVYNGIQDLKDCGYAVDDVFDAIMLARGFANLQANTSQEGSQGPLPVQS